MFACVCVCVCVCVTENVEQRKGRRGCVCCVCVATNCKILAVGWYGKLPFWFSYAIKKPVSPVSTCTHSVCTSSVNPETGVITHAEVVLTK